MQHLGGRTDRGWNHTGVHKRTRYDCRSTTQDLIAGCENLVRLQMDFL